MKFKSIQFAIATWAGASLVHRVGIMTLYSLYAAERSQDFIQGQSRQFGSRPRWSAFKHNGSGKANVSAAAWEYPLWCSTCLAQLNSLLDELQEDGAAQSDLMSGKQMNRVHTARTLVEKRRICSCLCRLGAEAFDDLDSTSRVLKRLVMTGTGRFMPWWVSQLPMAVWTRSLSDLERKTSATTGVRRRILSLPARNAGTLASVIRPLYEAGSAQVSVLPLPCLSCQRVDQRALSGRTCHWIHFRRCCYRVMQACFGRRRLLRH